MKSKKILGLFETKATIVFLISFYAGFVLLIFSRPYNKTMDWLLDSGFELLIVELYIPLLLLIILTSIVLFFTRWG